MGKIISVSDLDGNYSIVYQADAPPQPFVWFDHTNATAKVVSGKLSGKDAGGAEWNANFDLLPEENSVKFTAQVNTKNAPATTFLLNKNGQPTRDAQNYEGTLKIIVVGADLALTGIVKHGVVDITVNLRRK